MWMVPPSIMCDRHLLGEHVELHMLVGALRRRARIDGYVRKGLLEVASIESRHEEIVQEMLRRGFKHSSPLKMEDVDLSYLPEEVLNARVDRERSLRDLLSRCPRCRERYERLSAPS
ncbi:MAG: pyrimidine dimer DNA glycosylase/endonuclease V [Desulfurococcaceae archaeon]